MIRIRKRIRSKIKSKIRKRQAISAKGER